MTSHFHHLSHVFHCLYMVVFIPFKVFLHTREHLLPITGFCPIFWQGSKEEGEEWGRDCSFWEISTYFSHTKLYSLIYQTFTENFQGPRYLLRVTKTRPKKDFLSSSTSHHSKETYTSKMSQRYTNSLQIEQSVLSENIIHNLEKPKEIIRCSSSEALSWLYWLGYFTTL